MADPNTHDPSTLTPVLCLAVTSKIAHRSPGASGCLGSWLGLLELAGSRLREIQAGWQRLALIGRIVAACDTPSRRASVATVTRELPVEIAT
jgi:hypothetical protein